MKKSLVFVFAALLVPALALAQPKNADDWYKEGETQYNLGEFDKAAEAFKQGFSLEASDSKKPAYLYNVAQAYRQGGKCKDAAFFYKRYLSLKDQDTVKPLKPEKRAEIEQKINELEECARQADSIAQKPPNNTLPRDGAGTGTETGTGTRTGTGTGTTVGQGEGEGEDEGEDEDEDEDEGDEGEDGGAITGQYLVTPRTINARFVGGIGKVQMGDVPTGIKPAISITGGYPVLTRAALGIDVGAAVNFTPIPYKNTMTDASETSVLTTAVVNAAATYTVAPKIALRGDLGVGALFFSGLSMGNPFTETGDGTSGALTMLAVRVAASLDYAITPNIVATATPLSVAYSPATEGLRSGTILQLDFMVGVGYRM